MDAPDEPKLVEEDGANGRLRRRSRIAGGLLHGLLEQCDDAGNLALLAQFDAGTQHGAAPELFGRLRRLLRWD